MEEQAVDAFGHVVGSDLILWRKLFEKVRYLIRDISALLRRTASSQFPGVENFVDEKSL